MEERLHVFLSYAHKDKVLRDQLEEHLSLLKRLRVISTWHDRDIMPGTEWQQAIDTHLNAAHLILLLISPAFMSSEYCYSKEMKRTVERHEAGEARVIPVILRPVDWQGAPFGKLQALPSNALPVTLARNKDKAFLDIAQGIRKAVEELTLRPEAGSPALEQIYGASQKILRSSMSSNDITRSKNPMHSELKQHEETQADTMVKEQEKTIFGIDLGTTYSCIAYVDGFGQATVIPNRTGDRITPSVVLFEGKNSVVVGKEAKKTAILTPGRVVEMVMRHLGEQDWYYSHEGNEYTAEEIASYILRKLADDAEQQLGRSVEEVIIACPAYFGISQREAIARAGEMARLKVRRLINEPVAAAIAHSLQLEQDQIVLVYDLGGATFDVTVIEIKGGTITIVASHGDGHLGGRLWDEAILLYLIEEWMEKTGMQEDPSDSPESLQELWKRAETAKLTLSSRQETNILVTHAGQQVGVRLSRDKFNELTAHLLEQTVVFTKAVIEEAKTRGFSRFDQILLVGGSTRMPQIPERLKAEFNLPFKMLDPDEVVAKGAAIYGTKLLIDAKIQSAISWITGSTVDDLDMTEVAPSIVQRAQEEVAKDLGLKLSSVQKYRNVNVRVAAPNFGVVVGKDYFETTDTDREVVLNLIFANDLVPVSRKHEFRTRYVNQEEVNITVMKNFAQQEIVDDLTVCQEIGNVILPLPLGLPTGAPIEVTLELNKEGLLHVTVREPSSNEVIEQNFEIDDRITEDEIRIAEKRQKPIIVS